MGASRGQAAFHAGGGATVEGARGEETVETGIVEELGGSAVPERGAGGGAGVAAGDGRFSVEGRAAVAEGLAVVFSFLFIAANPGPDCGDDDYDNEAADASAGSSKYQAQVGHVGEVITA